MCKVFFSKHFRVGSSQVFFLFFGVRKSEETERSDAIEKMVLHVNEDPVLFIMVDAHDVPKPCKTSLFYDPNEIHERLSGLRSEKQQ